MIGAGRTSHFEDIFSVVLFSSCLKLENDQQFADLLPGNKLVLFMRARIEFFLLDHQLLSSHIALF